MNTQTTKQTTEPASTPTKQTILAALRAFVSQRSGMNFADYGEREAFMSDYRPMLREGRDARTLLAAIEWRDSITAEMLLDASKRAFSGRLTLTVRDDGAASVDYCVGQYFPTEYRAAVCAVCAAALWAYFRANMPAPTFAVNGKGSFATMAEAEAQAKRFLPSIVSIEERYHGKTGGDYLRNQARREFGRSIASRWFN